MLVSIPLGCRFMKIFLPLHSQILFVYYSVVYSYLYTTLSETELNGSFYSISRDHNQPISSPEFNKVYRPFMCNVSF